MGETVDDFVRNLQKQIFEETKEAYGEKAFQRWLDPVYMGAIKEPDGYACLTGVCGDTMEIFLKFENHRVKESSFQSDGCGSSIVCGSFAAEMSLGKNPDELLEITGEVLLEKLGKLPKEDEHCASLAAETLQEALNDYMIRVSKRGNSKA
ncbi:MAG: iron-sulfur cluster assembly scaffold protein [Desulfobacteraceae bacterium]|jgi:nitrogen fixation NifU-like protein